MMDRDAIDEAAIRLARESRQLLGLPEDGEACFASSSSSSSSSAPPSWIKYHRGPPTALQFSQILNRHVPVVFDQCMRDRPCMSKWRDTRYLVEQMGPERRVQVAMTPNGRADDVHVLLENRELPWSEPRNGAQEVFALPHEQRMSFHELIDALKQRERDDSAPVVYLQSQNSNLTDDGSTEQSSGDLSPLLLDLWPSRLNEQNGNGGDKERGTTTLAWADEAIGRKPEATNLWIGTEASRTSMHRDHYENLFTVIKGTKVFTLYPPCEAHFLCDDRPYDVWQWHPPDNVSLEWRLMQAQGTPPTPWIPIDPSQAADSPRNRCHPRFRKALPPLIVEVHKGETLYLPAGWFHHVAQRGELTRSPNSTDDDLCICVNWWYESDFAFSDRWALETFVKEMGQLSRGESIL